MTSLGAQLGLIHLQANSRDIVRRQTEASPVITSYQRFQLLAGFCLRQYGAVNRALVRQNRM